MNNERDRAEAAAKAAELYSLGAGEDWHETKEKLRFNYWAERFEWTKARAAANDFILRIEREKFAREGKST